MITTHRRGAAAVIALIILSLTGLTATTFTRTDLAASSSDAAAVAGWRALYAAESGIACTIAWKSPAPAPSIPPQIAASLDPSITRVGVSVVRVSGASAQATRHIDATVRRILVPRPLVTVWTDVAATDPMPGVSPLDAAFQPPTGDIGDPGAPNPNTNGNTGPTKQNDSPLDHDNGKGNDEKTKQNDSPLDHDNGKGNDGKVTDPPNPKNTPSKGKGTA